ncbi:hypothetical protein MTR_6g005560 [Medicago truncatula]|uniref:RNase H type-1 domain-containing protein n=1 Tax=Medicago truncatula TaxID=3880 RepID=G7KHJ3_MEDTR|nr:hypothetical protein MTR_6g005560 [Medicago truncatula]
MLERLDIEEQIHHRGSAQKVRKKDDHQVEIRRMYEWLEITRRRDFTHLIVESDSKLLMDMVTGGNYKITGPPTF